MYDIIIGRQKKDLEKHGKEGSIFLGRHYVQMGPHISLSNNVYLDLIRSHVVFLCGKRGGGKCLTGDTLITLSDGTLKPIEELNQTDLEILSLNSNLKIQKNDKSEFYSREVNKILEVITSTGKTIKLTPEHPLLTINGWTEAQELRIGSRIATPRIQRVFGEIDLEEDKVKILAYLIAEGHIGKRIQFTNTDTHLMNDFINSIRTFDSKLKAVNNKEYSVFISDYRARTRGKIVKRDVKGRILIAKNEYTRHSLKEYLKKQGLSMVLSENKFVPDSIFRLPKYKLALFLNRLFSCDGSIYRSRNSWQLSYSSVSDKLIRDVQTLLSRFGIVCKVRTKKTNSKLGKAYEIKIDGEFIRIFLEEIGFFGNKLEKQKIALRELENRNHNPNKDTIPKEIWDLYRPENWAEIGRKMGYKNPKSLRESQRYSPSRQKLLQIALHDNRQDIKLIANSDIYWDEIVSIKEICKKTKVYDITVPKTHNFVANDIIVHNSYSMGVISEGMALLPEKVRKNLSILLIDTMGVFWTMKYPNRKERSILNEWDLKPDKLDVRIFTPFGYFDEAKEKGIPTDDSFALAPNLLTAEDWLLAFGIETNSKLGVIIQNAIFDLGSKKFFSINDIIKTLQSYNDDEAKTAIARFKTALHWGIFATKQSEATPLEELGRGGQVGILDISAYATQSGSWNIKNLVTGIICKHLFTKRMTERKSEEYDEVKKETSFLTDQGFDIFEDQKTEHPLLWIGIDEAHEFLPKEGKTPASDALITILREGRQPGISLILASQQPGKIHTDVMTQSDIVISHRLTAKIDIDALGLLMQSYMRQGLDVAIDSLPREHGAALIFDDTNEKMFQVKVRPRITWHGGESPKAIKEEGLK